CITLWEALYGERPFEGDNLMELAAHVIDGKLRPAPRGKSVPGWLRRVCLRGLQVEVGRRWPDLPSLLVAMQRDPGRSRLRWGVTAGVAAVIVGALAWQSFADARVERDCFARAELVDARWNPNARAQLQASLGRSDTAYARDTAARV